MLKIFSKPLYVYVLDDKDDEFQVTVYEQDLSVRSRNKVNKFATSEIFDTRDEAIEWGEHQVEALSK